MAVDVPTLMLLLLLLPENCCFCVLGEAPGLALDPLLREIGQTVVDCDHRCDYENAGYDNHCDLHLYHYIHHCFVVGVYHFGDHVWNFFFH